MWGKPTRHTILIAAADPPLAGLQPDFLQHGSVRCVVRPLDDLDAALEQARQDRPRVVVDDARDDGGAGVELCRRLSADPATAGLPVILVGPGRPVGVSVAAVVHTPIVLREYFDAIRRFVPLPRRRHLRHAVNLRFEYEYDGVRGQAFSRDLSLYGAFLKTDRTLPEEAVVSLEFRLPGEDRVVRTGAVVRRCAPYDPSSRAIAGLAIEFIGMADDDLRRLAEFVERHLRSSLLGFRHGSRD